MENLGDRVGRARSEGVEGRREGAERGTGEGLRAERRPAANDVVVAEQRAGTADERLLRDAEPAVRPLVDQKGGRDRELPERARDAGPTRVDAGGVDCGANTSSMANS